MKVSIIIPCHNNIENLQYISAALDNQTEPADEIILIDDASTENIQDFAKQHGYKYGNVKRNPDYIDMGHRSQARKLGTDMAKYEYLLYMDGDVIPCYNMIEQLKNVVEITKLKKVIFQPITYNIKNKNILKEKIKKLDYEPMQSNKPTLINTEWFHTTSRCILIKKKYVFNVGNWDTNFYGWGEEDPELFYRLHIKYDMKFYYINKFNCYGLHIDHERKNAIEEHKRNIKYLKTKKLDYYKIRIALFSEDPLIKDIYFTKKYLQTLKKINKNSKELYNIKLYLSNYSNLTEYEIKKLINEMCKKINFYFAPKQALFYKNNINNLETLFLANGILYENNVSQLDLYCHDILNKNLKLEIN